MDEFPPGQHFVVAGSTANDATWEVASAALVGGNTVITVIATQTVTADAVPTGHIGGYAVTGATAGAGGTLTTPGDIRARIPVGTRFQVRGSTGNDNVTFTVASLALTAGDTVITVAGNETVASAVADGGIVSVSDSTLGTNDRVNAARWDQAIIDKPTTSTFTLTGDFTSLFTDGVRVRITGSTGSDGLYTVASSAYAAPTTTVTIDEVGLLVGDIAEGTASLEIVELAPDTASEFYTVHAEDKLRLRFSLSRSPATDLTDVRDANDIDWYGVALTTRLQSEVEILIAAVETLRRIMGTTSGQAAIVDSTTAADAGPTRSIAAFLAANNYLRTFAAYSGDNAGATGDAHGTFARFSEAEDVDDPFLEAGIMGKMFPTDPGSSTWKFQTLVGVEADDLTSTQRDNALAKNANIYASITATDDGFQEGTVGNAEFIDTVIGLDWYQARLEEAVFSRLVSESNAGRKVPFTDAGVAVIMAEIRQVTRLAVRQGVLAASPAPTFVTPVVSELLDADRAARNLTGIEVRATLAGAVHMTSILVEVEV